MYLEPAIVTRILGCCPGVLPYGFCLSRYSRQGNHSPRLCFKTVRASSPAHGSSVVRPWSLVPSWACDLHCGASPLSGSSLQRTMACSRLCQRDSSPSPAYHRPHLSLSARFPSGMGFVGHPTTGPPLVDTSSLLRTTQGAAVPHRRVPRCAGPHAAPGFLGGALGRLPAPPRPSPCPCGPSRCDGHRGIG